jgi:hypothetical protein
MTTQHTPRPAREPERTLTDDRSRTNSSSHHVHGTRLTGAAFRRLLLLLYRRGVTYRATADGTLQVEAPPGALTEADWTTIVAHKQVLLFLCSGGVTLYGRGREPDWDRVAQDRQNGQGRQPRLAGLDLPHTDGTLGPPDGAPAAAPAAQP